MKTLLTVVLCLLIFGCSNHAEEEIQVDIERVVAEAESKDQGYGRRSNIFFEDPDKDFIYPRNGRIRRSLFYREGMSLKTSMY